MSKNCVNCFAPLEKGGVCPRCGFDNAAYQPQPHHLPPGTALRGRYVIGRALGEGGFGITYAGYDTVLTRRVAVKEYYPSGAVWRDPAKSLEVSCLASESHTKLFELGRQKCIQEAKSLANLDDIPAIVRILDFFPENNTAYIIMEFVEGVTLREHARRQPKKLTLAEIMTLLAPVAEALEDVHSRGFVHRDVSPDNIMVTNRGKAKLLDFGAVKHMNSSDGTMTQNPIVKRGFSPMELYSTSGKIGPWTDVYALAATIFFLLVGQPLDEPTDRFAGDTTAEKLNGVLPPAQTDVMLRALSLQSEARQQSVMAFVNELAAAQRNPAPVKAAEKADESRTIPLVPEEPEDDIGETIPLVDNEQAQAVRSNTPGANKETKLIFDDVPAQPRMKAEPRKAEPQPVRQADANRTEYDGFMGDAKDDKTVIAEKAENQKPKSGNQKSGGKKVIIIAAAVLACVVLVVALASTAGKKKNGTSATLAQGQNTAIEETNSSSSTATNDANSLTGAKVGDTVKFGSYEQDNNASNGKEEIEWLVLKKEGNKALVVSKYALDYKPYNTEHVDVTWETCTLRKWLNNDFYNAAFNSSEQADIITTNVVNADNAEYGTDGGNNTSDKVFLLSVDEANEYFSSDEARLCAPTDYAIAQGVWTSNTYTTGGRATCFWWLRTPGLYRYNACKVNDIGDVYHGGDDVDGRSGIRPALWINL